MICLALIVFKVCIQEVWKEKDAQYCKNYKEFNQNQYPKGLAHRHAPEAIAIKGNRFLKKAGNFHGV